VQNHGLVGLTPLIFIGPLTGFLTGSGKAGAQVVRRGRYAQCRTGVPLPRTPSKRSIR